MINKNNYNIKIKLTCIWFFNEITESRQLVIADDLFSPENCIVVKLLEL